MPLFIYKIHSSFLSDWMIYLPLWTQVKKARNPWAKNADENDHKTVCRHSKNDLGSCGKFLYKGPQKKSLMLGWLLQRNFLGKAVRRWRRARAILSNLGRIEGEEDAEISSDEDSDNDEGDLGNDESDDNEQESNCVIDQNRNAVRFKGKQEREILMRAMTDWMLWLILKKWIFVSLINTLRFKTYYFSLFSSCWGS